MAFIKDKGRVLAFDAKAHEGDRSSRGRLFRANEVFEHFSNSAVIPPSLVLTAEGTAVTAATYGTGLGGWAVITSDDVLAKSHSLNGQGLNWEADRQPAGQPLVFECRVKVGTLATREFWFGISDALADTDPIALSLTSTFTTSVPTDGVYLGYSATPTSGAAFLSGGNSHTGIAIKTDVNTIVVGGTTATYPRTDAFVTNTFYTYRIEVSAAGDAAYFIDGQFAGAKGAALAANVPLTIVQYAVPRATAGSSEAVMSIDYSYIGGG